MRPRFRLDRTLGWLRLEPLANPEWMTAMKATLKLLNAWYANDRSMPRLIIVGDAGSGKTTLAQGAWKVASVHGAEAWSEGGWPRPSTATCHRWSELLDSRGDVFDDACRSDFAVIDDIGAEVDQFRAGALTEKLAGLLEHRRAKFSVITTNIPRAQWASRWDKRVESRLHHKSVIVQLAGGSDLRKSICGVREPRPLS